jgi:hypothetical protein
MPARGTDTTTEAKSTEQQRSKMNQLMKMMLSVVASAVIVAGPIATPAAWPAGVNYAYGSSVATSYSAGTSGTFALVPISGTQPVGNVPAWSSSCTCVTLTPAADGMSAGFKVLATATVGQSVTISATAPPYPNGAAGGSAQVTFTVIASPYPTGYTITQTN